MPPSTAAKQVYRVETEITPQGWSTCDYCTTGRLLIIIAETDNNAKLDSLIIMCISGSLPA